VSKIQPRTGGRLALGAVGVLGVALLALTGCSAKTIDLAATGAQQVPGSGNLYRFCDGPLAIYFSNYGGGAADEYEFIVYDSPFCATGDPNTPQEAPNDGPQTESLPDGDDG